MSIPANVTHTMLVRLGVPNGIPAERRLRVWIDGNSICGV